MSRKFGSAGVVVGHPDAGAGGTGVQDGEIAIGWRLGKRRRAGRAVLGCGGSGGRHSGWISGASRAAKGIVSTSVMNRLIGTHRQVSPRNQTSPSCCVRRGERLFSPRNNPKSGVPSLCTSLTLFSGSTWFGKVLNQARRASQTGSSLIADEEREGENEGSGENVKAQVDSERPSCDPERVVAAVQAMLRARAGRRE